MFKIMICTLTQFFLSDNFNINNYLFLILSIFSLISSENQTFNDFQSSCIILISISLNKFSFAHR